MEISLSLSLSLSSNSKSLSIIHCFSFPNSFTVPLFFLLLSFDFLFSVASGFIDVHLPDFGNGLTVSSEAQTKKITSKFSIVRFLLQSMFLFFSVLCSFLALQQQTNIQ